MPPALHARDLHFSRDGRPVLRDIDLSLHPNTITALVGPSGSGKTTLLWLLAGLLAPAHGRIAIEETGSPKSEITNQKSGICGVVFQQPALWDHLTVEGHLRLVLRASALPRAEHAARSDAILARTGLAPLRRRYPGQLSGGEQQRLALARALVIEPAFLLLDEPLAHLDGPNRAAAFALLRDTLCACSAAVLFATHDAADALRLAGQVVILHEGRILQAGPAREVYEHPGSLPAALALGPATQLEGIASAGALRGSDGCAILHGLPPALTAPQRLVLRPHHLTFCPQSAASESPAHVVRCEFAGGDAWLLSVEVGAVTILVQSPVPHAPGTAGRVERVS